eukprot:CAMPEP_0174729284 /NCGR_PEP_ID=MMETSP1094-20130205/53432_1 /TAXON_ID=156173 /ORGANISM="Chrysochromulina brevifilum, Strain UTEX LB 985" /LENGTH=69 /DNA_ID=CAMNT_0015931379 /DNA_START=70 /DNA_END=279 /DNA_ORIENTATION=+
MSHVGGLSAHLLTCHKTNPAQDGGKMVSIGAGTNSPLSARAFCAVSRGAMLCMPLFDGSGSWPPPLVDS